MPICSRSSKRRRARSHYRSLGCGNCRVISKERVMSTEESKLIPGAQPRPSNPCPQRRDQFRTVRLGENLDPLNPAVHSYLNRIQPGSSSRAAIRSRRTKWHCNPWTICASSKPSRSPNSTASSSSERSPQPSPSSCFSRSAPLRKRVHTSAPSRLNRQVILKGTNL
jgi:hypothetical protein